MTKDTINTDVLIIGSGIAGSTIALKLSALNPKTKIVILTRAENPNESNTRYAQGGIIAKGGDSLVEDILKSGDGLTLPAAAKALAKDGPKLVKEVLKDLAHVPFDELEDGTLSYALEGGHQEKRVAKVSDFTGRSIQEHLTTALSKLKNLTILSNITAVDLLTLSHHSTDPLDVYKDDSCVGIYGFDQNTNKVIRILAKNTVLCTGGTGQIYAYTTNPPGARGDGIAMAYRAGARLLNLEFEQFHPTALKIQGAPPFLISEAVRGEGARLTNKDGVPFMQNYYPSLEKPDLTTRDKVSRAIFQQMLKTAAPNVYLDIRSYMSVAEIKHNFPMIYETCLKYGVDITKDLIPVSPAAHYSCGGVQTDLNGKTTINNLYAAGEVACTGLHGANRLASTSLLEGLVFGAYAARQIDNKLKKQSRILPTDIKPWRDSSKYDADSALIASDMTSVRNIMWNMVGLVRKAYLLKRAITDLTKLEDTLTKFYHQARLSDELLGLRNMVLVSLLTAKSALANPTSSGCHYRQD